MDKQLNDINIIDYFKSTYGINPEIVSEYSINGFPKLKQSNYGEKQDCTLTSLTACMRYYLKNILSTDIYNVIEVIAKKYGYNGKTIGTLPIVIKNIYNETLKNYNMSYRSSSRYFKNIGYNFNLIKNCIDNNIPVILNIVNDGRNYYKNHTVTIMGYKIYNGNHILLAVQDNWNYATSYIDYSKLCILSSINY